MILCSWRGVAGGRGGIGFNIDYEYAPNFQTPTNRSYYFVIFHNVWQVFVDISHAEVM